MPIVSSTVAISRIWNVIEVLVFCKVVAGALARDADQEERNGGTLTDEWADSCTNMITKAIQTALHMWLHKRCPQWIQAVKADVT
jgi:hypothetical protein